MVETIKKTSLFFLFVALMFVKASAFHVYSHQNDKDGNPIESCTVCDLLTTNQHHHFTTPLISELDKPLFVFVYNETDFGTPSVSKTNLLAYSFFSRPPPSKL